MTLRPTDDPAPAPPATAASAGDSPAGSSAPAPATLDVAAAPVVPYAAPSTAAPPATQPDKRPGATGVRVTLVVTVLLTAGIVALIYARWSHSRFPSSCIQFVPNRIGPDRVESLD